jgi:hypothetical protein
MRTAAQTAIDTITDDLVELPEDFTGETPYVEPSVEPEPEPEPQQPVVDVEAIKAQARREAIEEFQRQQQQQSAWQTQQVQNQGDPAPSIYESVEQRIFSGDAANALREFAQTIKEETRREMDQRFQAQVLPMASERIVEQIAGEYNSEAKQYVRDLIKGVDPTQINQQGIDMFRRLARDVHRETTERQQATVRRPNRPEPIGSEPPKLKISKSDFDAVNQERSRVKLPPITVAEYNRLYSEANR